MPLNQEILRSGKIIRDRKKDVNETIETAYGPVNRIRQVPDGREEVSFEACFEDVFLHRMVERAARSVLGKCRDGVVTVVIKSRRPVD